MYTMDFVYTNYFGETVKETCRFQLTRPEVMEIATGVKGGFETAAQRMVESHDEAALFNNFQNIIAKAYGEVSPDGRRFIKSPELSKAFLETPMYEQLFDKLISDAEFQREFIVGLVPKDSQENVGKALADYIAEREALEKE